AFRRLAVGNEPRFSGLEPIDVELLQSFLGHDEGQVSPIPREGDGRRRPSGKACSFRQLYDRPDRCAGASWSRNAPATGEEPPGEKAKPKKGQQREGEQRYRNAPFSNRYACGGRTGDSPQLGERLFGLDPRVGNVMKPMVAVALETPGQQFADCC